MKNTYKKSILGIATVFALFGMAFTALAATPTLALNPNPTVTTNSASFSVFYNTNGDVLTSVAITYGTNPAMTSQTSSQSPSASSGNLTFSASGLTSGTLYYFEAIGVSSSGTVSSSRYTFTTAGVVKPTIQTNPNPTGISTSSATLSGFYSDNGSSLSNLMFEYGTSSSLGNIKNVSSYGTSGTATVSISGLAQNTTYWYRLSGTNAGGQVSGSTYHFATTSGGGGSTNNCVITNFSPSTSSINSGSAVYIYWNTSNCTSATLSPSGYSRLSSTGYIVNPTRTTRYTLNASNGSTSDSRSFTVNVTTYNPNPTNCTIDSFTASDYTVTSGGASYLSWSTSNCSSATLSPLGYSATNALRYAVYPTSNTTYRLTGSNGVTSTLNIIVNNNNGGGGGCVGCGSPNNSLKPTVRTDVASDIKSGGAVVHGYAHGKGSNINVWFEYGKTPNLGAVTSTQYGGGATNANGFLGGLSSNTTYYYRLAARNSYGITYGNILSFTTDRSINDYRNTTVTNRVNNNTNNNTNNGTTNSNDNGSVDSYNDENSNGGLSASAGSASFSLIPHTFLGWLILILVIIVGIILVRLLMKNEYHDRGI